MTTKFKPGPAKTRDGRDVPDPFWKTKLLMSLIPKDNGPRPEPILVPLVLPKTPTVESEDME